MTRMTYHGSRSCLATVRNGDCRSVMQSNLTLVVWLKPIPLGQTLSEIAHPH